MAGRMIIRRLSHNAPLGVEAVVSQLSVPALPKCSELYCRCYSEIRAVPADSPLLPYLRWAHEVCYAGGELESSEEAHC